MDICPVGFFCFDKNTLVLIMVTIVIITVFYINRNNYKIDKLKLDINNAKLNLENKLQDYTKEIKTIAKTTYIDTKLNDETMYLVDKDYQRIVNPLLPPERSYPYRINRVGLPINIPTRGYSGGFQQVGVLIQEDNNNGNNNKILPLYGEPTYPGSRLWKYYTGTDSFQSVKLPVSNKNRDCSDTYGCDEIYDGDAVKVDGFSSNFKSKIYKIDTPRYLPNVI